VRSPPPSGVHLHFSDGRRRFHVSSDADLEAAAACLTTFHAVAKCKLRRVVNTDTDVAAADAAQEREQNASGGVGSSSGGNGASVAAALGGPRSSSSRQQVRFLWQEDTSLPPARVGEAGPVTRGDSEDDYGDADDGGSASDGSSSGASSGEDDNNGSDGTSSRRRCVCVMVAVVE
jgi:hypothetical protein